MYKVICREGSFSLINILKNNTLNLFCYYFTVRTGIYGSLSDIVQTTVKVILSTIREGLKNHQCCTLTNFPSVSALLLFELNSNEY